MTRADRQAEIARRNNAISRVKPEAIFLAGLPDDTMAALKSGFTHRHTSRFRCVTADEITGLQNARFASPPLAWGNDRVGIGLLKALRARRNIAFDARPSPVENVPSKSSHLVVCEDGDELSQVIAANYAFSLRAGLFLIKEVEVSITDGLLENLYSSYEQRETSATEALQCVQERIREICCSIPLPPNGSITFVTSGLPFGFAVHECPSTHLIKYPDLGTAIINGFAAEQSGTPGVEFAALIDPTTTDSKEIGAVEKILEPRGAFLRTYYGPSANVSDITRMMELFPYDLLLIATHCGDVSGHRWTYNFSDSEGLERELIVDIALGVGHTSDPKMLAVTQSFRIVSLDGVDWNDYASKKHLYVGTAISDFIERTRGDNLVPVKKDTVHRVFGSAALKMHDGNLILLPKPLAGEGTPIIINNACVSWHRLARNFMFGNARAYVGTLVEISPFEAQDVIIKLFEKHFTKPLPAALWSAQRDVYGSQKRRPYVVTGVYTQWIRARRQNVVLHLVSRLSRTLASWNKLLAAEIQTDTPRYKMIEQAVVFYQQELAHFQDLNSRHPPSS